MGFCGLAQEHHSEQLSKNEQIKQGIMHHISDAHDYHLLDWNGHAISIPLPVILWTDNGLVTFLSSEFHHDDSGKVLVQRKGQTFAKFHGQIYYAPNGITFGQDHKHPTNARPLDFSITKNVATMFLIAFIMLFLFISAARSYQKNGHLPKGLARFLEPLILFIRDDIAIPNIGKKKAHKYMPYLLTIFFLIWIGNLIGLIPVVSGTLTNDILFTGTMAFFTLIITLFSTNKNYWKHIFATPGAPLWLAPIMIPVELLGIFTKPFALMVRLFANITAGHIVVLSLVSLIFIMEKIYISGVSILLGIFIYILELLVAFIQAYVFTLLSALLIGQAGEEEHH